jgi:hypothetical protein
MSYNSVLRYHMIVLRHSKINANKPLLQSNTFLALQPSYPNIYLVSRYKGTDFLYALEGTLSRWS